MHRQSSLATIWLFKTASNFSAETIHFKFAKRTGISSIHQGSDAKNLLSYHKSPKAAGKFREYEKGLRISNEE